MNQTAAILFYLCIAGLCLANWVGAYRENLKLYHATKPLVLVALLAFFAWNDGFSMPWLPFLIALVFSLLGDIFLMLQKTRYFIAGMAAFALAHFAYIFGFSQWAAKPWAYLPAGLALALIGIGFCVFVDSYGKDAPLPRFQKQLFKVYGLLVSAMALTAWLGLAREGWSTLSAVMAGVGGSLFLISDLMIALGKLEKRIPHDRFWVIITYHIAQMLIIGGILLLK